MVSAPETSAPASVEDGSPRSADARGRTVLAPRVVAKIAAKSAREVEGVLGVARVLGRSRRVYAEPDIDGHIVGLRLICAASFPGQLLPLTRRLRRHVTDSVERMCSLRVDHVDIEVTELRSDAVAERRVV